MLNISLHKSKLIGILHDIYANPELRVALGFKGGTAAILFYDLPRFSVDLDFDLTCEVDKPRVMEKLRGLLSAHGEIDQATEKRYTLFLLLKYARGERGLKVEISKRVSHASYEVMNYMGISMRVMEKSDMVACKLAALLTRKKFAMRDVFDTWYFLKNNWKINEKLLHEKTNLTLNEALHTAIQKINGLKKAELLTGLGDLLDQKQKVWCKEKLINETVLYLNIYLDSVRRG